MLCKVDGYDDISCPNAGEIIMVDLLTYDITCGPDDGRCPGAFSVGCDTQTETEAPGDRCEPTTVSGRVSRRIFVGRI